MRLKNLLLLYCEHIVKLIKFIPIDLFVINMYKHMLIRHIMLIYLRN